MRTLALSRRCFLLSSAIVGTAGLITGTREAWAFSEELMDVNTEALAFSACQVPGRPNSYHLQLLADIRSALMGKPQTEINARIAAATCPLCGCSLG